jgi:proline-specific peptidase
VPSRTAGGEGYIPFRGFRTWYRIVGETDQLGKPAILCVHGGPGTPHDYLEPLDALAAGGRRVVFYDQLGCGRSDQPSDPPMWTIDLFVEELGAVRQALGLDRVHLFGHSWGGNLALSYALARPRGLVSLVLASAAASMPHALAETWRLRAELPADVRERLDRLEAGGQTGTPEYGAALEVFYRRHLCRLDRWPDFLVRGLGATRQEVAEAIWGRSDFAPSGPLKDWDVTDRLHEIRVPTLILCGRYDLATPVLAEELHRGIRGSRMAVIEDAAHAAHAEKPEEYIRVLDGFLSDVEGAR